MKKVLVFGMTDNPGGVESVIMNYYRNIDRECIQFDFLCNSQVVAYESEIIALGGTIYKITSRRDSYIEFKKELNEFMKNNAGNYEAIWVNINSLVNIDYLIMAKKYGIRRRIIHCHNASNDAGVIKGLVHRFNKSRLAKYATDYWTCSDDASPWFFNDEIIQGDKYKVIPNAIDINRFKNNSEVRMNLRTEMGLGYKKVIGHVGRFHFQKNHKFLIELFEHIVKNDKSYHLLLVGQGELEGEIKELVHNKNLDENVTFCGVHMDIEKMYQAMDLFILPSVFEGLGVVALEAQCNGLPCVLADCIPHVVKVNDNVEFVDLNSSFEIWQKKIDTLMGKNIDDSNNKMPGSEYDINVQTKMFEQLL